MSDSTAEVDPRVTKKRLELTSVAYAGKDENGVDTFHKYEVVDYIDTARPGLLEAAIAAAQAAGWQHITVSEEFDAGPGGYDGPTHVPDAWDHELSGQTFPATPGSDIALALAAGSVSAPSDTPEFVDVTPATDSPVLVDTAPTDSQEVTS